MSTTESLGGEPVIISGAQDGDILVRNAQGAPFWGNQQPAPSGGGVPSMVGNLRRQEIDDTLLGVEVKLGGFYFDPSIFTGGGSMVLAGLVTLTDAGGTPPTLALRLYDMGTSSLPQAGDLRASRLFSITGQLRFEQTFLTPVVTLTPLAGEILNSGRIYEVRAELNGDVGDLAEIDWAGIQGLP